MEYKKISINGISYGESVQGDPDYITDLSRFPKVTNVDFRDQKLINVLDNKNHPEFKPVFNCMELLAFCHTIIT